jgi:pantothenate kinase-related protein Tda10
MSSTVAAEDTSSTAYKGQIIGRYIIERLEQHKAGQIGHATGASSPLMVAMQGPQGCGTSFEARDVVAFDLDG